MPDAESEPDLLQSAPTTKLLKLVRRLMEEYPHCVLLTRVGDFYELYYEQADEVGPLLEIQVVTRKLRNHHFRFTGFPARYIDRYLEALVMRHQKHVAICEQFQDPITKVFSRRLVRIITPGTLIDEQFLNSGQNNYLLAIYPHLTSDSTVHTAGLNAHTSIGLAWLDLATGDFWTSHTALADLVSDLARIKPREVIIPDEYYAALTATIAPVFRSWEDYVVTRKPMATFQCRWGNEPDAKAESTSTAAFDQQLPEQFTGFIQRQALSDSELSASWVLLRYVSETQAGKIPQLQTSTQYNPTRVMRMDVYTLRSLEILESTALGTKMGSLVHAIDQTRTKPGARLLADYLRSPLTSIKAINDRLDLVQLYHEAPHLLFQCQEALRTARDAQRAVQKLSLGYGGPADLLDVASSLEALAEIRGYTEAHLATLPDSSFQSVWRLLKGTHALPELTTTIRRLVDFDAPRRVSGFGFLLNDASSHLKSLYAQLKGLEGDAEAMQQDLQNQYQLATAKLVSSVSVRHYVETSAREGKALHDKPPFTVFQTLRGKHRFHYPPWTRLADHMAHIKQAIFDEEMGLYQGLVSQVLAQGSVIVSSCRALAQIDVATSLASLALDFGYKRPNFATEPRQFSIEGGRHPVVEMDLRQKNRNFIGNDCHLDAATPSALITGPNMGGKSTYLRQNAIIVILAQMGAFVPAHATHLSIVDRLFSRVGASDNLAEEQSTFMVEMTETAHILNHATPNSLVIIDEVGRGTATADGLAIAYATLSMLAQQIKCRSLIATHYHELARLARTSLPSVRYLHTTLLTNANGRFSFIHKVLPGVSEKSHGLQVALLAGFPSHALVIAQTTIAQLEALPIPGTPAPTEATPDSQGFADGAHDTSTSTGAHPPQSSDTMPPAPTLPSPAQLIVLAKYQQLQHMLNDLDFDRLTARQAMNLAFDIQELVGRPTNHGSPDEK
ncbi:MutS protein 1 [Dimargaris verticillata]|uniref:MutS protein 1 n=1 Tax=Dimargaris verticillata TaxID=2761393 RepID=A0A9W8B841_9FUNG|nr:MutS protein 1 [Dimargaris verticillata]